MATRPHDLTDLYLAPVALELEHELAGLSGLSSRELDAQVALRANRDPHTTEERRRDLLAAVTHSLDLHGWEVSWEPRGLRMSHDAHELVLGVDRNLTEYLDL